MRTPQIFRLMDQAHRALFRAADRTLAVRFGITAAQHGVLLYLSGRDGAAMSKVAAAIGIKSAATSGLVDRMEQKGLIERQSSETDGRSFVVRLLPKGREIVDVSKILIMEANTKLLEGFSADEVQRFASFLEVLRERATVFEAVAGEMDTEEFSKQGTKL